MTRPQAEVVGKDGHQSISPVEVSEHWAWVVACVLGGCVGMLDGSSSKLGDAADDDFSKLGGVADDSPMELGDTTEACPGKLGDAVDGSLAHLLDLIASIRAFQARFLCQLLLSEAIGVSFRRYDRLPVDRLNRALLFLHSLL